MVNVRIHEQRRKVMAVLASLLLVLGLVPCAALAEDRSSEQLQSQANEMAERVEQATREYNEATAEVQDLEEQIAKNEQRTAEIEERLPEQRERAASSIKSMYLFQQSSPGLIELILSSNDFEEFIATMRYIDTIHARNTSEVEALVGMEEELTQTKSELTVQRDTAKAKEDKARAALDGARSAKEELQAQADAVALEEAQAREAAIAAAQKRVDEAAAQASADADADKSEADDANKSEADEKADEAEEKQPTNADESSNGGTATFETVSGNTAEVEVAPEPSADTAPIVGNTTSSEVQQWADRINAYVAGSNLDGYGLDFAQAAADYGVDPRLSPAIAMVESGLGQICFKPHNAWGWGTYGWDSWPEAIRAHISGFASIYGSTLTLEGAKMYASNDIYDQWYSTVLSEMDKI